MTAPRRARRPRVAPWAAVWAAVCVARWAPVWLVAGAGMALMPAAASAASACANTLPSGSHQVSLTVGSAHRTAMVHVPASLPAGASVPLLLALHGWGGTGPRMERYSGFSAIADRSGFIAAYPSSLGSHWNYLLTPGAPDDVAFLGALIGYLEQKACADPQRVFATGVSNGGGMTALAGCKLASRIAAIAPVAGDYRAMPPCHPRRPLSVLEIHGTADPEAPYFGSASKPTRDGAPPWVNDWAARDGCDSRPRLRSIATRTTLYTWNWCTSGVLVKHIQIQRGVHQWPGANPPDPGPPATICASCTIWNFFTTVPSDRSWSASGGAGLPQ